MIPVWSYWEGECPVYIQKCIQSMRRVCPTYILVTPATLPQFIPHGYLNPAYANFSQPALRADAIRVALLARHGGFWFDADTVGMQDPTALVSMYKDPTAIYTSWTRPPYRILNGYIYLEENSPIAETWLAKVNNSISSKFNEVEWCSLGEQLLTNLLPGYTGAVHVPRDTFLPIDIDSSVTTFFSKGDFRKYITEHTVCYGLNHSWFMFHKSHIMTTPVETWGDSPYLIHQLLSSL